MVAINKMYLDDICTLHVNNFNEDFVGIVSNNGKINVYFPYGYAKDREMVKEQIRLLFSVLSLQLSQKKSVFSCGVSDNSEVGLPIQSYMFVIEDYFLNGLFTIREKVSRIRKQGKVNWSQTIKRVKPTFTEAGPIYLDFLVGQSVCDEESFISQIYQYCLGKSISTLWWFYTDKKPCIPNIKLNEKFAVSFVQSKLETTYNDRQKMLYLQMLAILNQEIYKDTAEEYRYGTNRFEYVWERMIQEVFGIANPEQYFPATKWHIGGKITQNSELRPDAIMYDEKDYFVLDAKYYKYSTFDGDSRGLPQSADINKQISYGEFLSFKQPGKVVYNAFILPNNAVETGKSNIYWAGYADGEWKQNNKEYEKVQAIFMDVKWLMQQAKNRSRKINELADVIRENYDKCLLSEKIC